MLSHINVGTGRDIAIIELARMVAGIIEYRGEIVTDPTKPERQPAQADGRLSPHQARLGGALAWNKASPKRTNGSRPISGQCGAD
jgi:hypothetical protein